jgi:integrase/recombinase XerD
MSAPTPQLALVPRVATPADLTLPDPTILAGQLAASSIATYRRDFNAYCAFAETPAAALDPITLARWRAHLASQTTYSPNTINRMLAAIKKLMKEAGQQGYLDRDSAHAFQDVPGVRVVAMKDRTRQHARTKITPGQMRGLCEAPDQTTLKGMRDAALLATLASSGARIAEVVSLTVGQLLTKDRGFMISIRGKNDVDYRDAPLSREAHRLITAWLHRRPVLSTFIFTSWAGRGDRPQGTPMTSAAAWQIVKHYAELEGLEHIKPHDFRRFVGTQLVKKDIRLAQKALGHKSITTTAKYDLAELESGLTDDLY